jgi:hypothetical protein
MDEILGKRKQGMDLADLMRRNQEATSERVGVSEI